METSLPSAGIEPSQAGSESQPLEPPSEPLAPLPTQESQRSRPISRTNSARGEQRPSHDKLERASSAASITTLTHPRPDVRASLFVPPTATTVHIELGEKFVGQPLSCEPPRAAKAHPQLWIGRVL